MNAREEYLLTLFRRLDAYRQGRARAELEMLWEDLQREQPSPQPRTRTAAAAYRGPNVIDLFPSTE